MALSDIVIDLLFVSLLLLLFYGTSLTKPVYSLNRGGYLSVETGKNFRGFFAIVVVFHHLAQRTEAGIAFRFFSTVGYLAVAFFFFLSGYGLQKSYIAKSDSYRKSFFLKRIPSVLIPFIIITAIYWMMYLISGRFYSLEDIFVLIFSDLPIVSLLWFIINILLFYVTFWLLMLIFKKHYILIILGSIVWYFLYANFCYRMGYGSWWYNASHLLIIGIFWAVYERKLLDFIDKSYFVIAPIICCLFIILFLFEGKIATLIKVSSIMISLFIAMFFVLCVILFALKVQIGNKVLGFLGDISLEIYLSQGIFMTALRSKIITIENDFLYCVGVLTGTIIVSYFLHIVFQFVLKKYSLLLNKLKI